jgi:DNA repair exonuclease SbcCD ATPase subunit
MKGEYQMSDVTFGVKVPEELKKQLEDLQKNSGLRTGKDFMQQLVNTYQVEKAKDSIPVVAEDLKELQTLTQRINNIYLNLGYRIESINKTQEEEKTKILKDKDSIIQDLQAKVEDLQVKNNSLNNDNSEKVNLINELYQRVNQLTNGNDSIKALNDEYKSKIDTMAGIVEQYKGYKDTNEELNKLLADSQTRNIELDNSIKEKDIVIEKLNSEIVVVKKANEKTVQELNTKHNEFIQSVKDKAELQREKAILELKSQQQQEKEELQSKYNKEIEEYQNKYRELLKEMEQKKAPRTTTTRKKQTSNTKTTE